MGFAALMGPTAEELRLREELEQLRIELEGWRRSATIAKEEVAWLRRQVELERDRSDRFHAEALEAARAAPPGIPDRPAWAGVEAKPLPEEVLRAIERRTYSESEAEELRAHALRRRDSDNWKADAIVAEILGGAELETELEAL